MLPAPVHRLESIYQYCIVKVTVIDQNVQFSGSHVVVVSRDSSQMRSRDIKISED